jgi:Xaa-Pro aminopeptidase
VFVGNIPPGVQQAFDAACRAQDAAAAALRPGVEGRAVERIGREIMEAAGLGEFFLYSGVHSVGVIEFEPPIFGPSSPAILREGMIISIDIPVFNAPWGGLRIEDGYLITASGAEHLHDTPYLLRV